MHGYTHVLVGGALAVGWGAAARGHLPPEALMAGALVIGVVSHAVLDMVPHDDERFLPKQEVLLGALALAAVLALGWQGDRGLLLAGALGGGVPDLEHVPEIWGRPLRRKWFPTHDGWLRHPRGDRQRSFLLQTMLAVLCGLILFLHGRGM